MQNQHVGFFSYSILFLSSAAILNINDANGARILGLFPLPIRSHYNFYEKLLLELSHRGHEVDVLTHFPRDKNIIRYTELSIAGSMPYLENNISISDHDSKTIFHFVLDFTNLGNEACSSVLQHPIINELKRPKKQYDLVITEMFATDCLLPYAHIYNVPIVGISSTSIMPWADERMGNPDNPAYISNYFLPLRGRLSFLEKTFSTIMNVAIKAWYHVISTVSAEIRGREVFGDIPPIENIAKNTIIFLANRHFTLDNPRPLVPGVIEIGGMHIVSPKEIIPKDLQTFIESSQNGVIFFSMGTLINMKTFSEDNLKLILTVFSKLKQNVVMKLNPELFKDFEISKNIFVSDYLPQVDILCHNKTQLFITQGGLLSIQEGVFCGVPMLGIPFYPNQQVNLDNCVEKQMALVLDYLDLSESKFEKAIDQLTNTQSFKANAVKLSKLFKDRPIHPLDNAVYWTEYAIKYGGKHLRTLGADLIIFEYLLVDVVVLAIFLMFIGLYIFYLVLQFLQELFDRPPPPKASNFQNEEKNQKGIKEKKNE